MKDIFFQSVGRSRGTQNKDEYQGDNEELVMLWLIALLVFAAGCIGGLVNSAVTGEFKLPYRDNDARVFRPGWIGTLLIGGVAAAASWGVYGPLASLNLVGSTMLAAPPSLRLAEFFGAVLIGFGGGRWFTAELDRIILSRERDALEQTKQSLVETLKKFTGSEK